MTTTVGGELILLDEELDELPLQPLAEDIAALHAGSLRVALTSFDDIAKRRSKRHARWTLIGALVAWLDSGPVIAIDLEQLQELGMTLEQAFAHELAHLIDPRFNERGHEGREEWANRVGPLLLATEPTTIVEALELAELFAGDLT